MPEFLAWVATILFWLGLTLLGYSFPGYPVLLWVRNRTSSRKPGPRPLAVTPPPALSFVLAAWNEETRIKNRLENLASCLYEGDREIVLVCDGSTDGTAECARSLAAGFPTQVVVLPERRGKAAALNRAVAEARGEILVFADARQRFAVDAVSILVDRLLATPEAAAVSGNLEIESSMEGPSAGIDLYWHLEKRIRHEESKLDSVIGCTGAIYAMWRRDYEPIPEDTLIDDVVIPMQALARGRRVLFEPGAVAYDPQALETHHERRRKLRTLTGNFQMLFRYPGWLLPRHNRCWWQLVSHKYLRLGGPLYLASCLGGSLAMAPSSPFFRLALAAQILAYLASIAGMSPLLRRFRLFSVPSGFLFLQIQSARAFFHYLSLRSRQSHDTW